MQPLNLKQNDQLRVAALFLERAIRYRSSKKNSYTAKRWKNLADEVGIAIFAFYKIAASIRKNAYIQRLKEASPCYFCINFQKSDDDSESPTCVRMHNMEEDSVSLRGGLGCVDYERGPTYDKAFVEKELKGINSFWSKENVLIGIVDLADRIKLLAKEELKEGELL